MRTWRVGTISMGAALILLGVTLISGNFFHENMIHLFNIWGPAVLIIVGCEILFFLFFQKKEQGLVRYDFLSILFIGILGFCGIAYSITATSGILGELEKSLYAKEITEKLPNYETPVPEGIKDLVIVNGEGESFNVQHSTDSAIHVFGTHTYTVFDNKKYKEKVIGNSFTDTKIIGSTVYLDILPYPHEKGLFRNDNYTKVTIVVPENIKVKNDEGNMYE